MKILLIQPPWLDDTMRSFGKVGKRHANYPPLGILFIAAVCEQHGHDVRAIDAEAQNKGMEDILSDIRSFEPDVIGLTATTAVFHLAEAIATKIKKISPAKIVIGGSHISPVGVPGFKKCFDFAVMGEGEAAFMRIVEEMEGGQDFGKIPGVLYRQNGEVCQTAKTRTDFIQDLDTLPFPARHLIDPHLYKMSIPTKGLVTVATTQTMRGCPFSCTFCAEPDMTGKRLRYVSVQHVIDEMKYLQDAFDIHHMIFNDSTFTVRRDYVEALTREMIDQNVTMTWECWTRANLVDYDLLKQMKRAGMVRIAFGVESGDDRILKLMNKRVPKEKMREAFIACKKLGIESRCTGMIGNAGETEETIMETVRFIRSLKGVKYSPLSIAIPYPGTELHTMAKHGMHGLKLLTEDFTKYSRYEGGVMEVNGMTPRHLARIQRKAIFLMHLTPEKLYGIVRTFGLLNLIGTAFSLLVKAIREKLSPNVTPDPRPFWHDNTTLQTADLCQD